jgi:isocitrate dehydrogenase
MAGREPTRPRSSSSSCRTNWASRRSASRTPRASASSRCRARAPSAWCARPSSTPSTTTAQSVTIVHKGNIMKYTEGGFRDWAYAAGAEGVRRRADRRRPVVQVQEPEDRQDIIIKDVIADAFLQQILLRPAEYDVIATLNLNGDYISDALAAQVGGIGIAPGANLRLGGLLRGHPRHRAEVRRQGLREPRFADPVGRDDAAPHGLEGSGRPDHQLDGKAAIADKKVTYDFARLMEGATQVSCSGFGQVMIDQMVRFCRSFAPSRQPAGHRCG